MDNRAKNVSRGIVMGVLNMVISIILPFISRTIIIYTLGMEYVGLGGLFTSLLNVLSLSELGIGAAITYALYKPIAEKDDKKVNAILNLYRNVYRVIGVVILILSFIMLLFLDYLVEGDLPSDVNLQALFIIYVANTVVSYFLFAYKKVLLTANQQYDVEVNISTITLLLQNVLQVIALLVTSNYYIYVIVFPVATILNNLISNVVIKKKYPQYKCEGKVEKNELISLFKNVSGAFLSKIGSTVYLSVDNIVISAYLGLTILGLYSNYYYIISSLIGLFAVIHNSLRPTLGNYIATESAAKNWGLFKEINYLYMGFVTICSSCCLILFQDFERIWAGKDALLSFDIVVLLVIYFFTGRLSAVLGVYQEAAGIWWHGKWIPLIAAIVNLIFNIVGVQIVGLPAVLLSSIIASVCVNLPGYTKIMFKHYFKEKEYLKEYLKSIVGFVVRGIIVIIVSYIVVNNWAVNTWIGLILKGICSVLVSGICLIAVNFNHPLLRQTIKKFESR